MIYNFINNPNKRAFQTNYKKYLANPIGGRQLASVEITHETRYKITEARIYSNTIPIISGITLAADFDTSIAKMGSKKRELNTVNYL